ncbi:hypothetical protein ACFX2I_037475 [Malus domestica]
MQETTSASEVEYFSSSSIAGWTSLVESASFLWSVALDQYHPLPNFIEEIVANVCVCLSRSAGTELEVP